MTKRELAEMLGLQVYDTSATHTVAFRYTFKIGNGYFDVIEKDEDKAFDKAAKVVVDELCYLIGDKFK